MILNTTGIELTPGNLGQDCIANGSRKDIECCCDECDYLQCCINTNYRQKCVGCGNRDCPRCITVLSR